MKRGRDMGIEEDTIQKSAGRRNTNATMDMWRYECGQDNKVWGIAKKYQEKRLKWYGYVPRREEHYVGRRAI